MPRNTYRWWTTGKKGSRDSTRDAVPDDIRQREHTCSWMFATECQVRAELYSTARRLGVDVDATCFAILQPVAPRLPGVLQAARERLHAHASCDAATAAGMSCWVGKQSCVRRLLLVR